MLLNLPRDRQLNLARSVVMGILNITPDSFSDGGCHQRLDAALLKTEQMLDDGASIIDVGGESTRPGAQDVAEEEELNRVIPIIEAIRSRFDCVISVDTSKAVVMREAVTKGADIINDVRALQEPNALEVAAKAAKTGVQICLMHMQGAPRSMQHAPVYDDVVNDVKRFFIERIQACKSVGIDCSQIILDPGFGFGKSLSHNYLLLQQLQQFVQMGYPVLAGMSRKSMIGQLLNVDVSERLAGSLACATIGALKGAQIIRVHDVKETVKALKIVNAMQYGA